MLHTERKHMELLKRGGNNYFINTFQKQYEQQDNMPLPTPPLK